MKDLELNFGYLNGDYKTHSHEKYEVHYFLKGEGFFYQNGTKTDINRDLLFFTKPGENHSLLETHDLTFFYLQFTNSNENNLLNELKDYYQLNPSNRITLSEIRVLLSGNKFSKLSGNHLFIYFLYNLLSENSYQPQGINDPIVLAQNYMIENFLNKISLQDIADHIHLEKHYFCKLFKKKTNITPISYFEEIKMEAACSMMKQGRRNNDISFHLGFCDETYFCSRFKKVVGITPSEFRAGRTIIYT